MASVAQSGDNRFDEAEADVERGEPAVTARMIRRTR